ncbi:hypothetical protein PZA11_005704 [Diplocarpon coronariae]
MASHQENTRPKISETCFPSLDPPAPEKVVRSTRITKPQPSPNDQRTEATKVHSLSSLLLFHSPLYPAQTDIPSKLPVCLPALSCSPPKAKSLTSVEIQSALLSNREIAAVHHQLATSAAPLSLSEARQRRASIKDERKRSIDFIRRRTISRAEQLGRPALEAIGHPNLASFKEEKTPEPEPEPQTLPGPAREMEMEKAWEKI